MSALKKWMSVGVVGLLFSLSSYATCMQMCEDTDAGNDPAFFGVVTVTTSCSPPGGPVHSTTTHYFDSCATGIQTEYFCTGGAGIGIPQQQTFRCRSCDRMRQGVCRSGRPVGRPTDAENPKHQCSTVSGGGPVVETPVPEAACL